MLDFERDYFEVEDFELGKCALCKRELSIGGRILIHSAVCLECSEIILAEDKESITSH